MPKKCLIVFLWLIWIALAITGFLYYKKPLLISENKPQISFESKALNENKDFIRVMSWNLNNYSTASRYENGVYLKNAPKPESHRKKIAKVIEQIAPDIILIQELGIDYLDIFCNELALLKLDYAHKTILSSGDEQRCIAIVSKLPFEEIIRKPNLNFIYAGKPSKVTRGLLGIKINGDKYFFTSHLRSRKNSSKNHADKNNNIYRSLEARQIAKVLSLYKDKFAIFSADFNDEPTDKSLVEFYITAKFNLINQSDFNGDKWTYSYKAGKVKNTFDFFLASDKAKAMIKQNALIYEDYKGASDHRPIYADISISGDNQIRP